MINRFYLPYIVRGSAHFIGCAVNVIPEKCDVLSCPNCNVMQLHIVTRKRNELHQVSSSHFYSLLIPQQPFPLQMFSRHIWGND